MELFEEMKELGLAPDNITFRGLVSATTAAGKWKAAQSFINLMQVSPCYHIFKPAVHLQINTDNSIAFKLKCRITC